MPTITRKIELTLCTEGLADEQRKAQWQLLYHINDNLYKAADLSPPIIDKSQAELLPA